MVLCRRSGVIGIRRAEDYLQGTCSGRFHGQEQPSHRVFGCGNRPRRKKRWPADKLLLTRHGTVRNHFSCRLAAKKAGRAKRREMLDFAILMNGCDRSAR
jgi:hypothetical protein